MDSYKSALKFIDYFVDEIQFYNNSKYNGNSIKMKFDIDNEIEFIEEDKFLSTIECNIFDKDEIDKYPFYMKVVLTGIFEFINVPEDKKDIFAKQNALAILFPYLRSIVANYTMNANMAPFNLPVMNIVEYLKDKEGY